MSTLNITKAGGANIAKLRYNGLNITDRSNARGGLTFQTSGANDVGVLHFVSGSAFHFVDGTEMYLRPTGVQLNKGEEVEVYVDSTRIFVGVVEQIQTEDVLSQNNRLTFYTYQVVDLDTWAQSRIVAEAYENTNAGAIISAIITEKLADREITAGSISTGATISKIVFNYKTVAEVFDELAELSGYSWKINDDKTLDFFDRADNAAPFAIDSTNKPYHKFSRVENRRQYRNRQYVRAGTGLTDSLNDVQLGDANKKTFVVQFPIGVAPTVEIDTGSGYTSQTVGIRGSDSGKDWYYQIGSPVVSQDNGGTAITATDKIRITYQGQINIVTSADNEAGIAERAAAETGDGIYESIDDRPDIDDTDQADNVTAALLDRYGEFLDKVVFSTYTDGLKAGQLIPIEISELGVDDTYLIDEVRINVDEKFRPEYRVVAYGGQSFGGWQSVFKALKQAGRSFVIRENEIVITSRVVSEAVTLTDSAPTVTTIASGFSVGGPDSFIGGYYET